jgi:O-antigen ligase
LAVASLLGVCVFLSGRRRFRAIAVMAAAMSIGLVVAGPSRIVDRLGSMNVASATSSGLAATNSFHVGDVVDASRQVGRSPVWGVGLGHTYQREETSWWAGEATLVHNGPLQSWIKFGILGLAAFVMWAVQYFRFSAALGRSDAPLPAPALALARSACVWCSASIIVSCFFTPSPYGSVQLGIGFGIVWGLTFGITRRLGEKHDPQVASLEVQHDGLGWNGEL